MGTVTCRMHVRLRTQVYTVDARLTSPKYSHVFPLVFTPIEQQLVQKPLRPVVDGKLRRIWNGP